MMKLKKYLLLVPAFVLTVSLANAQDYKGHKSVQKHYKAPVEECVFRDFEFQLDGFVAGIATCRRSAIPCGVGGGLRASLYFMRYVGLGVEAWWTGSRGRNTEHNLAGILSLRYPICSWNLAPYVLVGGGAHLNGRNYGSVQVGGGLEWRPFYHMGLFVEGRAVMPRHAHTFAAIFGGVRFIF